MTQKIINDPFEERVLQASDLKVGVGLSYRQQNDWDSKGVLPSDRKDKAGWRKYTANEVFFLLICKELRSKFGVPLEKLGFIKPFLETSHLLRYASDMIQKYGFSVYIMTDLKERFFMATDIDIEKLFCLGMFHGSEERSFLLISINPLIDKLLKLAGLKPILRNNKAYDEIFKNRVKMMARDIKEVEALNLIRNKKYSQVVVHLKDGKIMRANVEEELSNSENTKRDKELLTLIKDKKYQSITLKIHDGNIVRLTRSTPVKFDKGTEKS